MSSWRDQILKDFVPKVARLTLVADPDQLLLEEGILEEVRDRGFKLILFEDHIAFRYAYESKFRSRWDRGEYIDLIVVVHSQVRGLNELPFDLLQSSRRLSFNLGDIFPNLSYPIVAALDHGDLDILFDAQKRHVPDQLGENDTKEFLLRHVFEIVPELIRRPSDVLRVLIRQHYLNQRIPKVLIDRLIELLRQNNMFEDWPLATLMIDREVFFKFLQERWPIYLDHEFPKGVSGFFENKQNYGLSVEGPVDLPFNHQDIRGYIDNMFVDGLLHPVFHDHADILSKRGISNGIRTTAIEDHFRRLENLIERLQTSIPKKDSKHIDWFHFAHGWAELIYLIYEQSIHDETKEQVKRMQAQVDASFSAWLLNCYSGLINLPPVPPVMLHHIPRFLVHQMGEDSKAKMALIVVDGLALDQWLVLRSALSSRQPSFQFREQAVFAWIPSLTSVSRQAAFAGKAPFFFPNSIQTTEKEAALWAQFWVDQGISQNAIVYIKGLGDGSLENVSEELSHPKVRVAGIVVDKVDKIMHGMELGIAGMHNQVRQWASTPYLTALIELLLNQDFCVYLTSDHGNIEAEGCGRPDEGVIADIRGERVRIYPDEALRRKVKERFQTALEWDPVGLPEKYFPLLAPSRKAFVREMHRPVCHGGISIEELIVPLVKIERRGK
ncbi:MAG: BREX-3 system phosphatase PglZ [Nitrososphaerota archaeon]|nr:BREX-3 system phosphatase PglZ [Nitrososphaerota archaeon]